MERVFSNLSILRSRWFVSDMMSGSIILYIFVLFLRVFHWTSNARAPNRGSTTAVASCRRKRRRLRFWEVSPKERCEWLWIGSYPIISTYNCGKCDENLRTDHESLSSRATFHCWLIGGTTRDPGSLSVEFWMEGNANLDLLATGVICWVYYGYFITLPSCNAAYLRCLFAFEMSRINHQDVFSTQTLMYQIADCRIVCAALTVKDDQVTTSQGNPAPSLSLNI